MVVDVDKHHEVIKKGKHEEKNVWKWYRNESIAFSLEVCVCVFTCKCIDC